MLEALICGNICYMFCFCVLVGGVRGTVLIVVSYAPGGGGGSGGVSWP